MLFHSITRARPWHVALLLPFVMPALDQPATAGAQELCDGEPATIVGTVASDQLTGTEGRDVIQALEGEDVIEALGGDDLICGGSENDTILSGDGDDRIFGNAGGDRIEGGAGSDRIEAGDRSLRNIDVLDGGPGDDHLSAENAKMIGGPGDDVMEGRPCGRPLCSRVSYAGLGSGVAVDLAAGTATGDGNDEIIAIETVYGSQGDDIMLGDSDANRFRLGTGTVQADGRGGDDRIDRLSDPPRDAGVSVIHGGDGNDVIKSTAVNSAEADVYGDAGDDRLFGLTVGFGDGSQRSLLWGGPGEDELSSVVGYNTLDGGAGNDILRPEQGVDAVARGGAGMDTLWFRRCCERVRVDIELGTATIGVGFVRETLFSGVEAVRATDHRDILLGSADADRFAATDGDDTIDGRGGDDTLLGQGGDDTLTGGAGDDVCDGGPGTDTATGCEQSPSVP